MITFQRRYLRENLREMPGALHVFGDNVERKGLGGQAKECRGEPNAYGIPTKWKPTNETDAFFNEARDSFEDMNKIVTSGLDHVEHLMKMGVRVVWPYDNIGTGRAKLPELAPRVYETICDRVKKLVKEYGPVNTNSFPPWLKERWYL